MAIYAIGDVQGCWRALDQLLLRMDFSWSQDALWFVGDLVNRGDASLDVLRFVADLPDTTRVVLGNHDLHLLALAAGVGRRKKRDTLDAVLAAPDRDDLVAWLRARPLIVREGPWLMVHAGLLPRWSVAEAEALAREVEGALARDPETVLARYGDNRCAQWDDALETEQRWQVVLNAMTRMRMCTENGAMDLSFTRHPSEAPQGLTPWFEVPGRQSTHVTIICGHWAALGHVMTERVIALDSGCVWGGALTAVRLEDRRVFVVDCA